MNTSGNVKAYEIGANDMDEMESVGYYRWPLYSSNRNLKGTRNAFGATRVIILLIGVFVLPATLIVLPLYLKYKVFADFHYIVGESDVLTITDGISPFFCEAHSIRSEDLSTFNAFQINIMKKMYVGKKHLTLVKNISLDENSLQYWGFFFNRGTTVNLTFCSRYDGANIMVVKDTRDFHSCEFMDRPEKRPVDENVRIFITSQSPSRAQTAQVPYERDASSSESSNEDRSVNEPSSKKRLKTCLEGKILADRIFPVSRHCSSSLHLRRKRAAERLELDVQDDGYYFYVVHSDVDNEIRIEVDVFRPTYERSDYTRGCFGKSRCVFPLALISRDEVIVEMAMGSGIESSNVDNTTTLISSCQPRKFVYVFFAAAVLVLILLFAFV